jgi:hypothetical protein
VPTRESRPGGRHPEKTAKSTAINVPPAWDIGADWQRACEAVNGAFCVVIYLADEKVRRRVFFSLVAAQRHVDRARERGHEASVVLAELRPAYVLPGVVT